MINQYIRQYGKRLYGLCLHLYANPFDAEDLYQDTWLKVMKNMQKYDSTREFEPWLTKICVNTYRNTIRRMTRSPVYDKFSSAEEKEAYFTNVPTEEKEDYSELHEAIDRLPEKLRLTVILYYFRDMEIASAAETLGIPAGTVKSRLNKARKILREVLENETDLQF